MIGVPWFPGCVKIKDKQIASIPLLSCLSLALDDFTPDPVIDNPSRPVLLEAFEENKELNKH